MLAVSTKFFGFKIFVCDFFRLYISIDFFLLESNYIFLSIKKQYLRCHYKFFHYLWDITSTSINFLMTLIELLTSILFRCVEKPSWTRRSSAGMESAISVEACLRVLFVSTFSLMRHLLRGIWNAIQPINLTTAQSVGNLSLGRSTWKITLGVILGKHPTGMKFVILCVYSYN